MAAVFAGACLAVRLPAGSVLLAVVAFIWISRPAGGWRERARLSIETGALATLVFSPWLIRNAAVTGNPFAPALQSLFYPRGHECFDPVAVAPGSRSGAASGLDAICSTCSCSR